MKSLIFKLAFLSIITSGITVGCRKKGTPIPTPSSTAHLVKDSLRLIPLGAGTFIMGDRPEDEDFIPHSQASIFTHPQHSVTLSAFSLAKQELTQKLFFPFLESKDTIYLSADQKFELKTNAFFTKERENYPMELVNWTTAIRYCNWVTKELGSNDTAYVFNADGTFNHWNILSKGYRLPTEAEWEYACRAGSVTLFTFGNEPADSIGKYAWYDLNCDEVQPVGLKNPNKWGLQDMYGNAAEWCYDLMDISDGIAYYPSTPQTNPTGIASITPGSMVFRIVRGLREGGMYHMRSAYRDYGRPDYSYNGFRLAKSM